MRTRVSKAFTLVEILIVVVILGILAAIVIPQFTSASQEAQVGNVVTQLQTLRSQIELYRVRNNGNAPDSLFGATNSLLNPPVTTPVQEKYVRVAAANPRNKLITETVVTGATDPIDSAAAANAATLAVGWFYNSDTGAVAAAGFDEVVTTPPSATYNQWIP